MADNVALNSMSGGSNIAADEISSVFHQRVKVQHGADGSASDVSAASPLPVGLGAGAHLDAFGRLRVSTPTTIFDSKQLHDAGPRSWDDSEVSGSGTTSTHSADEAATTLAVSASTAGKRVRQTFMRFNYQPGKSQLAMFTGVLRQTGGGTGITSTVGICDDENGLCFVDKEGTINVRIRSKVSGSVVDTDVPQASWNMDVMDGTGASGITLDPTKAQIFVIDYEWLGVGRVRFGFVSDGAIIYCHSADHANSSLLPYMSTPNLPLRYAIENDGTGVASDMLHICSTIMSEGGADPMGHLHYKSTEGTQVDADVVNTLYAILGVRLKSTHLDAVIKEVSVSLLAETADDFEWVLLLNPTVAGTFTYSDETNSAVQTATGATVNTVTGGEALDGGWASSSISHVKPLNRARWLGAAIDGTRDELVLCARPLSVNLDIQGAITWRELV